MRTAITVIALLFASSASATIFLREGENVNTTLAFDGTLGCSGCVRSGFVYCDDASITKHVCCKADDNDCLKSIDNAKCSKPLADTNFAAYHFCGDAQRQAKGCGTGQITVAKNVTDWRNITDINYGEGCSYRVFSTDDGYPAFMTTNTFLDYAVTVFEEGDEKADPTNSTTFKHQTP